MSTADPTRVKKITEKVMGIPTLPTVISKMLDLVDNPKTSTGALAGLISRDQSLTAKILKMANSAYYGFSREISTVNMAIVVMGFNAVKEMGLSLSVFDMFKDLDDKENFDINEYWEHSSACGIAAKMLAKMYRNNLAGEAFVSGLLHDIGKIVQFQYLSKELGEIRDLCSKGKNITDAEMVVLGTTHGEIGSWLTDKWRIPVMITDVIKYHHSPWESKHNSLFAAFINYADYLCYQTNSGNSGLVAPPVLDDRLWQVFEKHGVPIGPNSSDELEMELFVELDKAESMSDLFSPKGNKIN